MLYDIAGSPAANAAGVKVPYLNFQTTWGGGGTVSQALRPFPQYGYINTDSYLQNVGQASYNALEVKVERRFQAGLNVLVSYTFSKTITDSDSIQPFYSTLQSQGGTQNPYDHKAEKAVSNQDVPNNFVVSYLYELPVGRGKKFLSNSPRAVNAVIGNWRVSGVQRYLSGQPISFFGEPGIPGFDNGIRPNRVPGQNPVRVQESTIHSQLILREVSSRPARPATGTALPLLIPMPTAVLEHSSLEICHVIRLTFDRSALRMKTSASTRPSQFTKQ